MSVAIASLTCPNSGCQSPNPETHRFCQRCCTPLLKRYLWVLGAELDQSHINTLIQNRFLVKSPQIVLDTQPHQSVDHHLSPSELELGLTLARPYFKLFKWRRHLPLPYTALSLNNHHSDQIFSLLEQAPICQQYLLTDSACLAHLATAETLTSAWSTAKALRQLNWLWQMAQLWQPLLDQHVASSLLELHRVYWSRICCGLKDHWCGYWSYSLMRIHRHFQHWDRFGSSGYPKLIQYFSLS